MAPTRAPREQVGPFLDILTLILRMGKTMGSSPLQPHKDPANLCWFCQQRRPDPGAAVALDMHEVTTTH